MRLTQANSEDLNQIMTLVNQAYRGAAAPGWTSESTLISGSRINIQSLAEIAADGETVLLIAKDADHQVQGCVALRPTEDQQWYLSMLAVNPAAQSGGVGKSIVADAEQFAKERGARSIKISVINSLIAWYERRGYQKNGVIEAFPYHDPSVGTPLRDDLALVMMTKSLEVA